MNSCCFCKSILEHLTAHASINHRIPVHEFDRSRGHCLRQLIHRGAGLLRRGARNSRKVSDTLNRVHGGIKLNACGCKGADITSHFRKVINRFIGILIQFVEGSINLLKVCALFLGICQNRLHSVNLRLIFGKTRLDRIDRELRSNRLRHGQCGSRQILNDGYTGNSKNRELIGYMVNGRSHTVEAEFITSFFEFAKSFGGTAEIKPLFQGGKRVQAGAYTTLELLIVELHFYNSFVDIRHYPTASLYRSLASWSNIGPMAGLM